MGVTAGGAVERRDVVSLAAFAVALLLAGGLVRGLNHDESQYVAAVALMRRGLPFRDFLYLQTPLQPLLLAPLSAIEGLPLLAALRGVNALAGAVAAVATMLAARAAGGGRGPALAAAALMLTCDPLLFAASVARNDALPLAFEAVGVWALLRAWRGPDRGWAAGIAGLAFGAAVSTKISYAIPAAVASAMVLASARELGPRTVAAFLVGGLGGVAPTLAFAAAYPDAFRFGVIDYGFEAPRQWRALNGEALMLSVPSQLRRFSLFLLLAPAPAALVLVACRRWGKKAEGGAAALLDALTLAGIFAALLPQPTYRQYLVPILPPLFARLGTLPLDRIARGWRVALAAGAVAGLAPTAIAAWKSARRGAPPIEAARDEAWVGSRTRGPVATLSPQFVAGGAEIDPRFAAGPFVFRTDRLLAPGDERRCHALTRRSLPIGLATSPPAAILVGGERRPSPAAPRGLDEPLARWAVAHGYRAEQGPSARLTLYLPPRRPPGRKGFLSPSGAAIALVKR